MILADSQRFVPGDVVVRRASLGGWCLSRRG